MEQNTALLAYITVPTEKVALKLGRTAVVERLAACANIIPGMRSIYHWEGNIEEACECVLLLKTTEQLRNKLTARLAEIHPYDCPCIVFMELTAGHLPFFRWIREETRDI